jgi:helicase
MNSNEMDIVDFDSIKTIILNGTRYDSYFNHQKEIMEKINKTDKNIIIQAPTSSGKTLAISPFIYKEFRHRRRIIYSVPSKAMIFDKINELNGYFKNFEIKPSIKKVGSDNAWKDGSIIIGTFEEIYTSALKQNLLSSFDIIILDDFHVLYGETRGYTLEKLITYILTYTNMRIIALSATIAPLNLLSKWLKDALILKYGDEVRPVQLKHELFDSGNPDDIMKINNLPMLVFCSTKHSTVSRAKKAKNILMKQRHDKKNDINEIVRYHKKNRVDFDVDEDELLDLMEYGIAYHHGSLEGKTKSWIEEVFKQGKLDYLFATTTLAYGINLPAKSVVIQDLSRWTDKGNQELPKYEWEQMTGRAGRTGKQEEGYVYSCYNSEKGKEQILNKYLNGQIEDVESSIEHDDCLKKALLDIISIDKGTEEEILQFFRNSFFMVKEFKEDEGAFGFPYDLKKMLTEQIRHLIDMGYIERKIPKRFVLTDFGNSTVDFLQKTYGEYNLKALRRLRDGLNQYSIITPEQVLEESIALSSLSEQSPVRLYPSKKNLEYLNNQVPGEDFNTSSATSFVVLNGWLDNLTDEEIFKKFDGIWATYVKTINETLADLLDFSKTLLSYSKAKINGDLDQLIMRVRLGVKENMINFIHIRGFGRKTTILTYKYFTDDSIYTSLPKEFKEQFKVDILEAFKTIDNKLLISYLSAVPQIGESRAKKIFEAIGREWTNDENKLFLKEYNKREKTDSS